MEDRTDLYIAEGIVADPRVARQLLVDRVRDVLTAPVDGGLLGRRVVRLALPVPPVDLFHWLHAHALWPRVYWEGRDDGFQVAALGAADLCHGEPGADYDTLRSALDRVLAFSDHRVRYFGGFRFDAQVVPSDEWAPFGTFTFVLPRFELEETDGEVVLVCNLLLPVDRDRVEEIVAQIDALTLPTGPPAGGLPQPRRLRVEPGPAAWRRAVEDAVAAFSATELDKVVLARRTTLYFDAAPDPVLLLEALRAGTPDCFHFLFQPDEQVTFLGASPERLFRRDGRHVFSEAVAGTRPRGDSNRTDAELGRELLASEKEQREHAYVRESIRSALRPLCETLEVDADASELVLARGRHLVSRVSGSLIDGIHGSEMMKALHPTPAVGGTPTEVALERIRTAEPFDRGWYAGPFGWIGTEGAEFSVAIRSGLLSDRTLSLYSGAGIVAGSDAAGEWREVEQKISDFLSLFGGGID